MKYIFLFIITTYLSLYISINLCIDSNYCLEYLKIISNNFENIIIILKFILIFIFYIPFVVILGWIFKDAIN